MKKILSIIFILFSFQVFADGLTCIKSAERFKDDDNKTEVLSCKNGNSEESSVLILIETYGKTITVDIYSKDVIKFKSVSEIMREAINED